MTPRYRITAVADSDSYLKLACTTLDRLGPEWERRVVLVRSPLLPTDVQQRAAAGGTFMEGSFPRSCPRTGWPPNWREATSSSRPPPALWRRRSSTASRP